MRLIGTINDERNGILFSNFLDQKGIIHQIEKESDRDWGSSDYGITKSRIWITEEDQVEEATQWLNQFMENPLDPQFTQTKVKLSPTMTDKTPPPPPSQSNNSPLGRNLDAMGPVTRILLIGCSLLFFIAQLLTINSPVNVPEAALFTSPVEKVVLYDYPTTYEMVDRLIKVYGVEALQDSKNLPPEASALVNKINHTPYWEGIYAVVQKKGFKAIPQAFEKVPMFEKIKEGQVWRLITPIFLHANLLHLFFNMLWLLVLGKQIEQKIGSWRYIVFIVLVGIFSNTCQYIMGGPNFIGISGVLCGMLTFIWIRQKWAPWEGYQLDRMTILFMLIYIFAMAGIQFFSFILEKTLDVSISPGIANMAHLSGAFLGVILGMFNYFSWRPEK